MEDICDLFVIISRMSYEVSVAPNSFSKKLSSKIDNAIRNNDSVFSLQFTHN